MGRVFIKHVHGPRIYVCSRCKSPLTNKKELLSMRFTGSTGRAYLFSRAVNLTYSDIQDRMMLTGRHMVRDVFCQRCNEKLGWMYEYAMEENQKYKEGRVILEKALIVEVDTDDSPTSVSQRTVGI